MESNVILTQVIILFLVMLVGFYAKKREIITSEVSKKLSELLLNITMPFLIISSFHFDFSRDMLISAGLVFLCSLGIHVFSALLGRFLYYKYPHNIKSVLRFVTIFSNCGFMGFPVLASVFGSIGVFYGSIYVIPFNIIVWTYGITLFTGEKDFSSIKKALINPGIISVAIGMVIFLFSIKLPEPIYQSLTMVGSMTTPLSMLIVGALLADTHFKEIFKGFPIYYGTAVRLLLVPLLTLVILKLVGVSEDVLYMSVVLTAMPAAANTAIFAEKSGGDAVFASRIIGVSTLLSIATIPLVIVIMNLL